MKIISEESRSSFTLPTVSFFPSRVVAPPRAPPKRAVSDRVLGEGAKAEADAARPSTRRDCFMVR